MDAVHYLGRLLILPGHQMGVRFQRECLIRVTDPAGDRLNVPSLVDQDRDVGVSESVEMNSLHHVSGLHCERHAVNYELIARPHRPFSALLIEIEQLLMVESQAPGHLDNTRPPCDASQIATQNI